MNASAVRQWFAEYLDAFAACGRGEREVGSLLPYYAVPILFTTDSGVMALVTKDQVVAAIQQQIDQMRAANFDRTEVLASDVEILNSRSALYRVTVSRQRRDGAEIARLTFTELLTDGAEGPRISAIALHGPSTGLAPKPPDRVP